VFQCGSVGCAEGACKEAAFKEAAFKEFAGDLICPAIVSDKEGGCRKTVRPNVDGPSSVPSTLHALDAPL
jgi:hypothetical protein